MAQTNGDAPRELFLIDGNSLAYRAFFALPESIATSDGRPTNAIFGFASMLVKILTDYGEVPTVVVWDAGMSGRKELSADYKAQRSSRPDLLKQQWPHLRPLVDAFGYRNISVEGFEADDVIAALVEQARDRGINVMVVTGDRDAYQLVGDGVRIMTTSRGITDTKVYDRDGRRRALRHPARADPGLHRPQGRHQRQHPRRPGHRRQDRRGAAAALRRPRGRPQPRRRHLRRQAQAEPHRARRRRPALQAARDDDPRCPDRPRHRGRVHEDPGSHEPAPRLPRVGAARPAPPARGSAVCGRGGGDPAARGRRRPHRPGPARHRGRRRQAARRRSGADRLAAGGAGGRADPGEHQVALRRLRGRRLRAGRGGRRPRRARTRGRRPARRRARRQGARRRAAEPRLRHRAGRLPARPRPPRLPARRAQRGARSRGPVRRRAGDPRRARPRSRGAPTADAPRARADRPDDRHRDPARVRAAGDREDGHQARHAAARGGRPARSGSTPSSSSARSGTSRARSS